MNRVRGFSVWSIGIAAAGLAAAAFAEMDYSRMREDPRKAAQRVLGAKTDLLTAVRTAEQQTKARACAAEVRDADGKVVVAVRLVTADKTFDVLVDAATGSVVDRKEHPMTAPTLPGDPVSGEPVTTPSGLAYYDLKVGTGDAPSSPATRVSVHYTGWLVDGRKFDSSVDRGQPATFALNQVIRGWTEGVGSMKVGGKRKLIIPYALAYGEPGRPPVIPARALLVFDVELLAIVP